MQAKLGVGPMSYLVNEALGAYAQLGNPLMLIASRNQIDCDSGYVMTTKQLARQMKPYKSDNLWVCRDHCGPYFLDSERNLSINDAIDATKRTIAADIEAGFDLIHIDTSRCDQGYQVAEQLFKFCLDLNPKIRFEFGTEENVGVTASLAAYQADVDFASQFPGMEFVVAQTGSLTMEDRQTGTFDLELVRELVNYARDAGVKLKEHNADYLTAEQIQQRRAAGVDAVNIAPQLGVMQTALILKLAANLGISTREFTTVVLESGRWRKWMLGDLDTIKVLVAGHYCFHTDEYRRLEEHIGLYVNIERTLRDHIHATLTLYNSNLR